MCRCCVCEIATKPPSLKCPPTSTTGEANVAGVARMQVASGGRGYEESDDGSDEDYDKTKHG